MDGKEADRITGKGKQGGKVKTRNNCDPNFTVLHRFVLLFIQIVSYQQRICTLLPMPVLFCVRLLRHKAMLVMSLLTQLKVILLIRTFSSGFIV